jgi:hypothetical protein
MPGVLTRTPESEFQVGPDPSSGLGFLDVFGRAFVLVQDSMFAIGIIAILLGSVYFFTGQRKRSPRYLLHGIYLTTFLFLMGVVFQGIGWVLTGSTRIDDSMGVVGGTISFPASLLTRTINPPGPVPNPATHGDFPVHVLGRVFSIEVLFISFLGVIGILVGAILKFSPVRNPQGEQWLRSGLLVTTGAFMLHTLFATFSWIITGTVGMSTGKSISPGYANSSRTTIHLPDDQLVNTDLIYPLVPTQGDIWPVINALERSFQLSVTTVAWIGLIGFVLGAVLYFGIKRGSGTGQRWMVGGIIIILIMVSMPIILSTGTWVITGETQAFTEVRGGPFAESTTWESQTAEGWSSPDGALAIVATNKTQGTHGLHIVGDANREYDVENNVDGHQNVTIVVARGSADISVSVDGTTVSNVYSTTGVTHFTVPDGSTVHVSISGFDIVVEEVVIREVGVVNRR